MMQPHPLTPEQEAMIKAILTRIRGALAGAPTQPTPEPAHLFQPVFMFVAEVQNASKD
ncbi:hypothetical protein [Tabrizicola sp.]|uniref:hypothetical protein n=1 Tax=Tabrizicola sp. TaxID=2005166 RepID=UPI00286A051A|nr:hypothetical protein [Tabrizicola sp.]